MELSRSKIKNFFIFQEMELLRPRSKKNALKKFLYLLNKSFSYIFGNGTFLYSTFLIFLEMKVSSLKNQKFQEVTFQAQKLKKSNSEKFLVIREMELSSPKYKKLLYFRRELESPKFKKSSYIFFLLFKSF